MTLAQAVHTALKPVIHLDVETFSECNLGDCGVYKYAEDPSTELLVACFKFGGSDKVYVWVPRASLPAGVLSGLASRYPRAELILQLRCPVILADHIEAGREVRAHNAQFERVVLNNVAGQRHGIPRLSIHQMVCTAAKMANHGLPRALGNAAEALGTHPKDESGRTNMLALCRPRSGKERRWTPESAPERYIHLYAYCCDDVLAEEGVDLAVPDLSPSEAETYLLDQQINDRGIAVDLEAVADVQSLIEEYKREIEVEFRKITGLSPTQRDKIATWIRTNGWPQLGDMQKDTVIDIVANSPAPAIVKRVLQMYSTYGMKAVTKYTALTDMVCKDGRLHGMFQYYGANTGRWSSTGVQLQNLFRPVIDDPEVAIEAFKERSLEWIRFLYPGKDPMKVFASCIRGMLVAGEGKKLIFPDFGAIESRGNAWAWNEEWKLQAFRDFDAGTGPDMYCVVIARALHLDPRTISKKDIRRQWGKVMDLAFGYEGGVSAMLTWAELYGIDLEQLADSVPEFSDDVIRTTHWMWDRFGRASGLPQHVYLAIDGLKQVWRNSHLGIKTGWKQLNQAAKLAVFWPGKTFRAGKVLFSVREYNGNKWLYMKLPSGRRIAYYKPYLDYGKQEDEGTADFLEESKPIERFEDELDDAQVRYWGVDTKTRRYMKTHTYGGKLDENYIQGFSRDALVVGMKALDTIDYPAVGSVHDEGIFEVADDYGSLEEAGAIICRPLPYAPNLPLAYEGHRAHRYRK